MANAIRLGHENAPELRSAYDVERALDAIEAIRGATTPAQRDRLKAGVDATADGDPA